MDFPGEKLVLRLWETVAEKGIGGLLRPWQSKREARALLEVRRQELLVLAQAEKDASDLRTGRKRLRKDGNFLSVEPSDLQSYARLPLGSEPDPSDLAFVFQEIATESVLADAVRKEVNVAKALLHAEQSLENDATESPDDKIDEDWLFRWRDCAAEVSTEKLQSLWGSLLAGELKSPGSFSLRTLEFLRNLSQDEAKDIETLFRYAMNHWIIRGLDHWDDRLDAALSAAGITFSFLLDMQELGVISGVESGHGFELTITSGSDEKFTNALISRQKMLLITHENPKKSLLISGYSLTSLGIQLERLGTFESDEAYIRQIGEAIASRGFRVFLTTPDAFEQDARTEDDGFTIVGEFIEAPKRPEKRAGKSE